VVASDFDNDGYPDFYVACDSTPSLLYHNQKDGTFQDVGLLAGVALNEDGQEQGGMGVAVADYDEDGKWDILKTNFSDGAIVMLRSVVEMLPQVAEAHYNLGLNLWNRYKAATGLKQHEDLEEAVRQLKAASRLAPREPNFI
jgi:hypothetical protein